MKWSSQTQPRLRLKLDTYRQLAREVLAMGSAGRTAELLRTSRFTTSTVVAADWGMMPTGISLRSVLTATKADLVVMNHHGGQSPGRAVRAMNYLRVGGKLEGPIPGAKRFPSTSSVNR